MGQRLIALAAMDRELSMVAALDSPQHPRLGEDVGIISGSGNLGVLLTASLNVPVNVVVDFSLPAAAESMIETCRQKKIPLVVATTGLSPAQTEKLQPLHAKSPCFGPRV